jgi:aryl-alcohol dehydrogenase-like predicted oxidoreductase
MRYKKLGRSGLLVSELCLGTNTFGGGEMEAWKKLGGLDQKAVNAIMKRTLESGINFIDTADTYAAGQSEQRVGQAIRDLGVDRADVIIATKTAGRTGTAPNSAGASRGYLSNAVERCLRRLQTDYIDVYMIHHFDPVTPLEESLRTLDDLVRSGKVRYIGCSNFAAWQAMKAIGISECESLERFEVIEWQWSAASRDVEREIVPLALDQKIGIMVWGALLGGVLTGKFRRDGSGEKGGRSGGSVPPVLDRERVFDVVDALAAVGKRHEASAGQIALAWLLHQPAATSVLFGNTSVEQFDANVKAAEIKLSAEDLKQIDDANPLVPAYGMWVVRGTQADRLKHA